MTEAEQIQAQEITIHKQAAQIAQLERRCDKLQTMHNANQRYIETLRKENERLKQAPAEAIFRGLE